MKKISLKSIALAAMAGVAVLMTASCGNSANGGGSSSDVITDSVGSNGKKFAINETRGFLLCYPDMLTREGNNVSDANSSITVEYGTCTAEQAADVKAWSEKAYDDLKAAHPNAKSSSRSSGSTSFVLSITEDEKHITYDYFIKEGTTDYALVTTTVPYGEDKELKEKYGHVWMDMVGGTKWMKK